MKLLSNVRSTSWRMWSTERGVVKLLKVSDNIRSDMSSTFDSLRFTFSVDSSTVIIDGRKANDAGKWLEKLVTLVKVGRTLRLSVFIAAMRLQYVANEVASTLESIPASFELTDKEFVLYAWGDADFTKAVSAIDEVVEEGKFEVYEFAITSRSRELFYSRLDDWTTQYVHSVHIEVDQKDHCIYHIVGLVRHVKLVCEDLAPFSCCKIVRSVTPSQAQLLQAHGDGLFDSVDDCHMTLSADNSEMVVYCAQHVMAEVTQKCDSILGHIQSLNYTVPRDTDTDMTVITELLNDIETKNRVVIELDDTSDCEVLSEQMFVGPSYCVDISDKTQLRLVDADITDLCVDAIVSTIDEHGTPNTALAKRIVSTGGPAVKDKLKQKVTCKLNSDEVVMSGGGQLPCKSVIHVQYPPAQLITTHADRLSSDESAALKCCMSNILATCKNSKYRFNTIAIPVIGSYSNKKKMADCMQYMAEALCECVEVIKSLSVRHIVLVAYGTDNFTLFHDKLQLVFRKTKFHALDIDKCVRIKDCCVGLMTGDLLNMKVDAIVVAISPDKDLTGGGLATKIYLMDPNIQKRLLKTKWPDEATGSGVIVCQSKKLASRYVFFIHLPKRIEPNAEHHFSDSIYACLKMAAKQGIKSIAFPVLGTGVLKYSIDSVSTCMTTLIESFCQGQPGRCTDIRIVRYRDTEGITFLSKFESLAQKYAGNRLSHAKANSQNTRSKQTSQTTGELQFNITGFSVESVVSAINNLVQVFTGNSGYRDNAQHSVGDAGEAGYHGNVQHSQTVETGVVNSRDKSPVSASESSTRAVWVYEDIDGQWKEFIPDIQEMLEEDYSFKCDHSKWLQHTPYERYHTVNFTTQPMTYMVKCGDIIKFSTVVERRVKHASNRSAVTHGVDERRVYVSDDEVDHNIRAGKRQVNTAAERSTAPVPRDTPVRSPGRRSSGTSDDNNSSHVDYSHMTTVQPVTTARPSANRKNNNDQQQVGDTAAIHQPTHECQSSTHDTDTMDTEPTYVSTALHRDRLSANRNDRSPGASMDSTPSSQSQQLSSDQVKVQASDNVAMTTKYTWDSNIPSYWAPMDGRSVKAVVLHPTDIEYQLVADTFLASLGNTLATVVQIERIQNPLRHKQYMNNREHMDQTNPPATQNERHLWHGTTVTLTQHGRMPITAINARGFNKNYKGQSDDTPVYGDGIYFNVDARGAARKAQPDVNGHRHMYWCRVLTGEYTRGRTDMVVAPVKTAGTYDLYDSVVDIVKSPTMFVVFEDAHAYPKYLITFK